jgi:hypothetical protein
MAPALLSQEICQSGLVWTSLASLAGAANEAATLGQQEILFLNPFDA